MSFKITCDSSADLTDELYKKNKISVIIGVPILYKALLKNKEWGGEIYP